MAGSKSNCMGKRNCETGDNYWVRIKHASERECWVYENRKKLGLDNMLDQGIIVTSSNDKGGSIKQVKTSSEKIYNCIGEMGEPSKQTTKLLATPILGLQSNKKNDDLKKDKIIYIDVKIGRNTKSGSQIRLENGVDATVNWHVLRHNVLDKTRKNRKYGFDFENELKGKLLLIKKELQEGKKTKKWDQIKEQLNNDLRIMSNDLKGLMGKITFVGTSVLFAINLDNIESSRALLIDPDHPILLDKKLIIDNMPKTFMTEKTYLVKTGVAESDTLWKTYAKKWEIGFSLGMKNLISYFSELELMDKKLKIPDDISSELSKYKTNLSSNFEP